MSVHDVGDVTRIPDDYRASFPRPEILRRWADKAEEGLSYPTQGAECYRLLASLLERDRDEHPEAWETLADGRWWPTGLAGGVMTRQGVPVVIGSPAEALEPYRRDGDLPGVFVAFRDKR